MPLRGRQRATSPSRRQLVPVAKAGTPKEKKGFGNLPPPPPPRRKPPLAPLADMRPLVDSSEPFVPRGPTMRKAFQDSGLMDSDLGPNAGVLPQVVADRMIRRVAGFAGVPLGALFLFFGAYFVAKYKYDISVIPVVVAYTTLGCIGASGVGISWGIMSSSWDEEEEGTKFGWKEAKVNVVRARDGLMKAMGKDEEEAVKVLGDINKWRESMRDETAVEDRKGVRKSKKKEKEIEGRDE